MRNSFRWRIVIYSVVLVTLCLGGLSVFLYTSIRNNFIDAERIFLVKEARGLANQTVPILQTGSPYTGLDKVVQQNADRHNTRITVILPNGVVIGESSQDPANLENHSSRPEVKAALQGQEMVDTRFSDTLKMNMMYAAVPISRSSQILGVARVAYSLTQIQDSLANIFRPFVAISILTLLGVVILVIFLADYIVQPLRELTESVIKIGSGRDIDLPFSSRLDEIGQLNRSFHKMVGELNNRFAAVQAERTKMDAVLSHMTDGILIVDQAGKVQLINPAAQRIFSTTENAALGRSLIEAVRQHQLVEIWLKCQLTQLQQTTTLELPPERIFIQGIATPLTQSLPGNTLIILQDLTRLRRLEMVRRDFVSNVSHELRTPLASLKALTETLTEGALEDPPAARRFLTRMDDEIDNLTQIVQELLELSRIESGRVPIELNPTAPVELIQPALERMQLQAVRAGLILKSECSPDLPNVLADATRLQQVLVNLIHNAIKFTLPGGEITVRAYQDKNCIVFAVNDTGVGIAADDLQRIFERFYKADRSRSGGGTGLGLSISRHLVELHNGSIWADSVQGKGSTFYFSLPLTP